MATVSAPKTETQPQQTRSFRLKERDKRALDRTFSIDTRALALIRILLAAMVLIEALFLPWSHPEHPNAAINLIYQYSDLIILPFALMMLVGYRTRLAIALVWAVYSIPIRADLLNGIDVDLGKYILNIFLLWAAFLPLGRHLSIDARNAGQPANPVRFLSVASAGIMFQLFVVYFSAGLVKDMGEWVIDATAMEAILSHPNYETAVGTALLAYPGLLAAMSIGTVLLEIVGSALLLIPGKSLPMRRMVLVPLFILLQIGIAVTMDLGLFPYVMMPMWLIFLPPRFWDWLWNKVGRAVEPTELMFDSNKWRNTVAGLILVIALISNFITWMYYPDFEGFTAGFKTFTVYLVLYQRWLMFSAPSSLPGI